jgi:hypothetical protein
MIRLPALTFAAFALAMITAAPAFAQSEEDIYNSIESIHGDADGFFELFSTIQQAMQYGDSVTIAANASYPLLVNANGESYDILEESDLIDNYNALVSAETQDAVANQDVDDLIVNSDGVGLGNGAMWISNLCVDDACSDTYWAIISINS